MAQAKKKRMAKRRKVDKARALGGNFWGGLALGLIIAGAAMIYNHVSRSQLAAVQTATKPVPAAPVGTAEPAPAPVEKPHFDFYTILPELEVVIPEQKRSVKGAPPQVSRIEAPGTYVLQMGSFRNVKDADRLKAQLALMGVEANIETVTVNSTKWHRVRVGPYSHTGLLNDVRSRLAANDVDFMLLKIRD
jgi:cell division protein FtsN